MRHRHLPSLGKHDGCDLFESCLECPLPCCVFELPQPVIQRISYIHDSRNDDAAMLADYRAGMRVTAIAIKHGVSYRCAVASVERGAAGWPALALSVATAALKAARGPRLLPAPSRGTEPHPGATMGHSGRRLRPVP